MALSDEQIREMIKKNRHRLTKTITRCFYEDEWQERVADEDELFKFIKEVLEANGN